MTPSRRPIATRNREWARALARRLTARGIRANRISQASVAFAALAFLAFWGAGFAGPAAAALLLVLAAVAVQVRLLCNLLDGLVAVEGGRAEPDGPFWNEAPDRAADILILWGAGLAGGQPALGLAAAALAVTTAYLREFGRAEGAAPDFSGPMAKPHRMAAVTIGALAAAAGTFFGAAPAILAATLWLVTLGTLATALRRARNLLRHLGGRR